MLHSAILSTFIKLLIVIKIFCFEPGRVAQSVTCLATDACLTADPGVASTIPVPSHTFVEIDHEMISTVILKPAQEKVWVGELTVPQ